MKNAIKKLIDKYPKAIYDELRSEITLLKKDDYAFFISEHRNKKKVLGYSLQLRYYSKIPLGKRKVVIWQDTALVEYNKLESVIETVSKHNLNNFTDVMAYNCEFYNPERVKKDDKA